MGSISVRVLQVVYDVNDVVRIAFAPCDPNVRLPFKAGQFLTFVFRHQDVELRRSYSLCSSPALNETLFVAIKRIENGEISRFLHQDLRVGDTLLVSEANGFFYYEPNPEKKRTLFLFGAGVGITPLFSMLKTALTIEKQSKVVLVYSNRSEENTLFYNELKEWQQNYPDRLKIVFLFSNAKNLSKARLNSFLIHELIAENLAFDKEDALFYTCGPVDYMDLCRIAVLGNGFEPTQVKRETFVLHEDEMDEDDSTQKVVDKSTYGVTLKFNKQTYHLDVPYPKRILDVALEQGIPIPYSCSGGVCGTCVGYCTKGNVQMTYNEVLTDDEVAAGKVLVCTGRPTEEDTVIQWL
jgi:ring-1,2-phenylacetyl-CoA epoxidase subunit PaaE